ncbi:MAG: hypothetical protein AVDCRST_MAG15-2115, partial [uncultured Rubellimicrobium sp.]
DSPLHRRGPGRPGTPHASGAAADRL